MYIVYTSTLHQLENVLQVNQENVNQKNKIKSETDLMVVGIIPLGLTLGCANEANQSGGAHN